MLPGEIYLAQFPFGDAPVLKLRPVLLLTGVVGPVPEAVAAYISSVVPVQPLPSDLLIDPTTPQFQTTCLRKISVLRLHKIATLHTTSLVRFLGRIEPSHQTIISAKLKNLFHL